MKGGITDNGEESQGREEEGRQETVTADLARTKRGPPWPPFQLRIADCGLRIVRKTRHKGRSPQVPSSHFLIDVIVCPSHILTARITSHCCTLSTTSMPAMMRPKTVYFASRCGCGECVIKYWLPPVSGQGSSAIPTVPRRYGSSFSSSRTV